MIFRFVAFLILFTSSVSFANLCEENLLSQEDSGHAFSRLADAYASLLTPDLAQSFFSRISSASTPMNPIHSAITQKDQQFQVAFYKSLQSMTAAQWIEVKKEIKKLQNETTLQNSDKEQKADETGRLFSPQLEDSIEVGQILSQPRILTDEEGRHHIVVLSQNGHLGLYRLSETTPAKFKLQDRVEFQIGSMFGHLETAKLNSGKFVAFVKTTDKTLMSFDLDLAAGKISAPNELTLPNATTSEMSLAALRDGTNLIVNVRATYAKPESYSPPTIWVHRYDETNRSLELVAQTLLPEFKPTFATIFERADGTVNLAAISERHEIGGIVLSPGFQLAMLTLSAREITLNQIVNLQKNPNMSRNAHFEIRCTLNPQIIETKNHQILVINSVVGHLMFREFDTQTKTFKDDPKNSFRRPAPVSSLVFSEKETGRYITYNSSENRLERFKLGDNFEFLEGDGVYTGQTASCPRYYQIPDGKEYVVTSAGPKQVGVFELFTDMKLRHAARLDLNGDITSDIQIFETPKSHAYALFTTADGKMNLMRIAKRGATLLP